ncbi:hypothetical protein OH492_27095 [Vibrio chagasii]|nr:hypothetical protein [Vibrio chagasii]
MQERTDCNLNEVAPWHLIKRDLMLSLGQMPIGLSTLVHLLGVMPIRN